MEKESEPKSKEPSWRKLGQQWERKYIRLRQHIEPGSCQRTWLLFPPPRLRLIQPAPSKSPVPLTPGRHSERAHSDSPFPQSPQLSSSLFRKQSPVKWEALLISAPMPGAPFAWQSTGWGLWADDGRMRWEERDRWVAAVVGGGEEDKSGKTEG